MFTPHLTTVAKIFFLSIVAVMMSSCLRIGPEGPIGPQGPQGPQGPSGQDGNANVISINYAADPSHWYDVGNPGEDGYFLALDLDVPEITQSIVDNGMVLVYYRASVEEPWTALPYTIIAHNPDYIEKLDMIYDLGFVGIQSQASDRNATAYDGIFRVIVASAIPVGKMAIDYSSYEEVAEMLNIYEGDQEYRLTGLSPQKQK